MMPNKLWYLLNLWLHNAKMRYIVPNKLFLFCITFLCQGDSITITLINGACDSLYYYTPTMSNDIGF